LVQVVFGQFLLMTLWLDVEDERNEMENVEEKNRKE
jgi:hypothetical protein